MAVRWGILGPGRIARRFAEGIQAADGSSIQAVASRSEERAQQFADDHGGATVYTSYEELVQDPDVDCVYVATPHPYHLEQASLALNAKKPVLCEKPLCVNGDEVAQLIQCAKDNDTFLMEAMWTRCMPVMKKVKEWVDAGKIGGIKQIKASFGFAGSADPEGRHMNLDLAGGSLLDVGVYVVALAQRFFPGHPTDIQAIGDIGSTGVDEQCAMLLQYEDGPLAIIDSAVRASTDGSAWIFGEKGSIKVDAPFWCATKAELSAGDDSEVFEHAHKASGFEWECEEVDRCLAEGLKESPLVTHADSIQVMAIMDAVRKKIGLHYPFESQTAHAGS